MNLLLKKAENFVKNKSDFLNFRHTQLVRKIAREIAEKENADKLIVELAVLFHDVSKTNYKGPCQNIESAAIADNFLKENNADKKIIKSVKDAILRHMGPFKSLKKIKTKIKFPRPKTKEDMALFDADMINLFDYYGIAKIIYIRASNGKDFKEAVKNAEEISKDAYNSLQTKTGRKIGRKIFVKNKGFFDSL